MYFHCSHRRSAVRASVGQKIKERKNKVLNIEDEIRCAAHCIGILRCVQHGERERKGTKMHYNG